MGLFTIFSIILFFICLIYTVITNLNPLILIIRKNISMDFERFKESTQLKQTLSQFSLYGENLPKKLRLCSLLRYVYLFK